ncbi:Fer-1-like protein 5 [Mus musculus] [Rhizoctonia solani]|uniref:Fer-1-like protein 5 [Mus musculus] n=1 Tax=Rhizoctonia solani TaxID=456999 RepID=A0A0K6GB01_9AGAM|nr:Fer-1-like protein 5 [Mus musculus] [Rhizoctonia solani]
MRDYKNTTNRGFGFLHFENERAATAALIHLQGSPIRIQGYATEVKRNRSRTHSRNGPSHVLNISGLPLDIQYLEVLDLLKEKCPNFKSLRFMAGEPDNFLGVAAVAFEDTQSAEQARESLFESTLGGVLLREHNIAFGRSLYETQPTNTLMLLGTPTSTDAAYDFRRLLDTFSCIQRYKLIKDRMTNEFRGFTILNCGTVDNAWMMVEWFNREYPHYRVAFITSAYEYDQSRMSKSRRSTTGCSVCKARQVPALSPTTSQLRSITYRRKKCDETKPQCTRCTSSGRACSYDYVEHSEFERHRVKRTKPAPRATYELVAKTSPNISTTLDVNVGSPSTSSYSGDSTLLTPLTPPEIWVNEVYPNSSIAASWNTTEPISLVSPFSAPSQALSPCNPIDASLIPLDLVRSTGLPAVYDPFPATDLVSQETWYELEEDEDEYNREPEDVQTVICTDLALDKNARENTLPFVLHCYSQWVITRIFEPLTIAQAVRNQVIQQFTSENTRYRSILIANVMIMFAKNLAIDDTRKAVLTHLVTEARDAGSRFIATPVSFVPSLDRQKAMRTLDSIFEILTLQTHTQPTADCIRTLDYAAPVFRRACVEPPGKPINLPNLLLDPSLNLRHFACVDVIQSVTTGRPTYFQYEVPFSLELCERMYKIQDDHGSQWLYGLPDQFILLLAWINSMRETSGPNNNLEAVAWIENNLPKIKIATSESGDPLLRIGRMVVLEGWRFAVLVYMYMVLCKAGAYDPRVIRAQKSFMRLVRGVKPGRIPDAFLINPMTVVGVATIEQRDRDTLRKRILGVHECSESGTAVSEVVLELEDVWLRTENEGRAAVWPDWREAVLRVTGR